MEYVLVVYICINYSDSGNVLVNVCTTKAFIKINNSANVSSNGYQNVASMDLAPPQDFVGLLRDKH